MLLFARSPSAESVREELRALEAASFTYNHVGATQRTLTSAPPGFVLDSYQCDLGHGDGCFDRARAALTRLENYPPSFTRIVMTTPTVEEGAPFATVAKHFGLWSVHPCRVIYMNESDDDDARSFAFGFGTLPGHAEAGEERFLVRLRNADQKVTYEVQAFSRPHALLARAAAPITRGYQRRFQRETREQMRRLVRS